MKILLPQETYDTLEKRLSKNHHAHRSDSPFDQIRRTLARDAETTTEGVWVRRLAVQIARDALAKNIKLAGAKYQSGYDEILLLWLDDALADTETFLSSTGALSSPQADPSPSGSASQPPHAGHGDPVSATDGEEMPFLDLSQLPDLD